MELRHLRYFVAVAEEENVTKAAAGLNVSQPPLTRQIKDLEHELGVSLFERTGRSLKLTEAGKVFLEEARAVLSRVEEAVETLKESVGKASTEFHLGYAPSPTRKLLPPLLKAFREAHPQMQVLLHDMSSPEMLDGLDESRLHAAFMVEQPASIMNGHPFTALAEFPAGIVVSKSHEFAKRKTLAVEESLSQPFVVYASAIYPDYHRLLRRILGRKAQSINIVEACDSGPSFMAAIEAERGIGLMGNWMENHELSRLAFIPFDPPPDPVIVGIATRKGEPCEAALSLLKIEAAMPDDVG